MTTTAEIPRTTAPPNGDTSIGMMQLLSFAVASEGYAIPIDAVSELVEVPTMTNLPLLPNFVRGVMNLRGSVVPIIDLAPRLLGLAPAKLSRRSCVVIVDATDGSGQTQHVGMLVDAVHEVLDVAAQDIEDAPSLGTQAPADFLDGVARVRGALIEVLALPRVLDLDQLAELIGAHEAH